MIFMSDEVTSKNPCRSSDKNLLFTSTNILFYFWHLILCHKHQNLLSSMAHFAVVTNDGLFWLSIVASPQLIYDIPWMRETGIVTSYSLIVIAHANRCKGNLHLWKTAMNIDIPPPGIHGLACKTKLCIHSQTSTVPMLKFGNGQIISYHTLKWI